MQRSWILLDRITFCYRNQFNYEMLSDNNCEWSWTYEPEGLCDWIRKG